MVRLANFVQIRQEVCRVQRGLPSDAGSLYLIHMSFFLNAKHRVELSGTSSVAHNHSWRLETEFRARFLGASETPAVEFADLEQAVRSILRPYEARYLNDVPPFNRVVPMTENIARFLYGAIRDAAAVHGVDLIKVTLWEGPTKGVTVNTGLPGLTVIRDEAASARDHAPRGVSAYGAPPGASPPRGPGLDRSGRPGEQGALRVGVLAPVFAAAAILGLVVAFYHPYLTAQPGQAYPWGWDSWGHLFKAQYLLEQLTRDNLYPVLLPWWYNGLEIFRYWSPLPIYVLAVLARLSGDVFVGGAWLIPLAAAFGGLSWLFFVPRLGWLAATVAGLAWTVWPDHIILALHEGNLPRVLATALFPLLFLSFLESVEGRRWPWSAVCVVALLHVVVLCHAMTAAMVAAAFSMFAGVHWLFGSIRARDVARGLVLLVLGILSASWWLVPSLSGGLLAMSPESMRELVPTIPGRFVPWDSRGFLMGLVSVTALGLVALTWRRRTRLSLAAAVCALGGVLITLPVVIELYVSLPLGYLLWPTRFTGLTAVPLLLALVGWRQEPVREHRSVDWPKLLACLALPALLGTSAFATNQWLHQFAVIDPSVQTLSHHLAKAPGWRVCLFSPNLSSEAAYFLSTTGRREQVYGFAWQGAKTAPQLVLMNEAVERGDYAYAIDRAWQSGATDIALDHRFAEVRAFADAAEDQHFAYVESFGQIAWFRREGKHHAFISPYRVLAVGRLAGATSILFPSVETGRPSLESYTEEELRRYDALFLTGLEWSSRERSEEVVRDYLKSGGRVVVDLTQFPSDVLNGRPTFFAVTGESIALDVTPILRTPEGELELAALAGEFRPWVTHFLVGLDQATASFSHYGQPAAVLGSKKLPEGQVEFVGLNIPFHAHLTRDPVALAIMRDLLLTSEGEVPPRAELPLDDYQAGASGYSFELTLPEEFAGELVILPFAAPDSVRVWVDGAIRHHDTVENLVAIELEPGRHLVQVRAGVPPLMPVSTVISIAVVVFLAAYVSTELLRVRRKGVTLHESHS